MLGTGLLVFREVLEAALIVSIVAAATRGVSGRGFWIGAGIGGGVVGAIVVAVFASSIANAVSGIGQELFNATVLLAAVAMIGWHAIWMASHGKELALQMKSVGSAVQAGSRPLSALLIVVAIAVLREGSEVVLFLYGQAASGAGTVDIVGGIAVGVAGGVAVGFLLYFGLLGIPMRYFFSATNWLMLLLAAGLASQAAGFLDPGRRAAGARQPDLGYLVAAVRCVAARQDAAHADRLRRAPGRHAVAVLRDHGGRDCDRNAAFGAMSRSRRRARAPPPEVSPLPRLERLAGIQSKFERNTRSCTTRMAPAIDAWLPQA